MATLPSPSAYAAVPIWGIPHYLCQCDASGVYSRNESKGSRRQAAHTGRHTVPENKVSETIHVWAINMDGVGEGCGHPSRTT